MVYSGKSYQKPLLGMSSIVVYSGLYLYKSMIWGYHHFRKPPFKYLGNVWIIPYLRSEVKGEAVGTV